MSSIMTKQRFQKNFSVGKDFYDLLVELKNQMDVDNDFFGKLKDFLGKNRENIFYKDCVRAQCHCGIVKKEDCRQYYHYVCDFGMKKMRNGTLIRIEFDNKKYDAVINNCRVYFNGEYMNLDEMVRKVNGLERASVFCTKIKPDEDGIWDYLVNTLESYYSTPTPLKLTKEECDKIINNLYNKNSKNHLNTPSSY